MFLHSPTVSLKINLPWFPLIYLCNSRYHGHTALAFCSKRSVVFFIVAEFHGSLYICGRNSSKEDIKGLLRFCPTIMLLMEALAIIQIGVFGSCKVKTWIYDCNVKKRMWMEVLDIVDIGPGQEGDWCRGGGRYVEGYGDPLTPQHGH